jgi:hypothetical protein
MSDLSITKIILLFYMLLGNSLLQPLLSKQWVETVNNDRMIQHIIGMTTMLTLSILVAGENENYENIVAYAFVGYVWFLFSTKIDIHFNVILVILLLANYMYDYHLSKQNKLILNDKILSDESKEKIIKCNNLTSNYIMFSIMGLVVVGMFMYSEKKEIQYGGGYNIVNFLLY